MGVNTAAGSKLAISAANPATEDATGYAALTYTEVAYVSNLGDLGSSYEMVEFQPLDGPKLKLKGPRDEGSLNPSIALDDDDAGQTLLRTASEDGTNAFYSFKITRPDGAVRYFQGPVFGMPESIGSASDVITASPTIEACTEVIRVAAP